MDDTLRNVAIGLSAFLAIHIALSGRAHHAAVRQVSEAFDHTGSVQIQLRPSGPLGLEFNDFASVDIEGLHVRSDRLPFYLFPRRGWKGSIHRLRLRLTDFTLAGLPIVEFDAELPHATYDLGHAFYRGRLVLRTAESGPGEVRIAPAGLRTFILKKFQKTLSDVKVRVNLNEVTVSGQIRLIGPPTLFSATGRLAARDGRYLDLTDPTLDLGGRRLGPQVAATLLARFNPVLDTYADLGLQGFFEMRSVRIGEREVIIDGVASLPPAPPGMPPP